jgi:type II secretory pathway component GspD/PulD (secretin)
MNKKLMKGCLILASFLVLSGPVFSQDEPPVGGQKNRESAMLDVLDLKAMDIMDVLKLISQKSGVNIVANQNVKGKVTVYLRDVSVIQALEIIVDAYGWAFAKDGDVIKIMTDKEYEQKHGAIFGKEMKTTIRQLLFAEPKDVISILNEIKSPSGKVIADSKSGTLILMDTEEKVAEMGNIIGRLDVPVKTEVFELSYAAAEELSAKVTEMLTADIGKMRFDIRSNRIVVADTSQKLKDIREMISAFDQKDKQVLIEAKIIQVVLSDRHKMGIDWSAIVSDFHNLTIDSEYSLLGETEKRGKLSIGTIASDDYEMLIEALQTIGYTEILSSPRITTVNKKEAKILVGSTEPYVTTTTTTPASGPTTTAESVNFIEVGVKLYVTPTIHKDDFITMKIKPEVSSVVQTLSTGNNNSIPVVETSEAETTVVVKDGITIVIGGLIKEEKIKETKKIPFLGDIPFVKHAFMSEDDAVSKTELVIFLTPKIISGDVDADASLFSEGSFYPDEY